VPGLIAGNLSSIAVAALFLLGGRPGGLPVGAWGGRDVGTSTLPAPVAAIERVERTLAGLPKHAGVRAEFATRASDRFSLVSDLSDVDADRLLATLERTADAVQGLAQDLGVEARPLREQLLSVAFSQRSQFERFAKSTDKIDATWMSGYWAPGADRIVFRADFRASDAQERRARGKLGVLASASATGEATVAHEAAHQLLHRIGVQRRSANAPLWISEGLAIAFEPCAGDAREAFAPQPERDVRVAAAIRDGKAYSLAALVASPRLLDRDAARVDLFYDQAWSVTRWLMTERHDAFAHYLTLLREQAGTLNARRNLELFETAFGSSTEIERAWRAASSPSGVR